MRRGGGGLLMQIVGPLCHEVANPCANHWVWQKVKRISMKHAGSGTEALRRGIGWRAKICILSSKSILAFLSTISTTVTCTGARMEREAFAKQERVRNKDCGRRQGVKTTFKKQPTLNMILTTRSTVTNNGIVRAKVVCLANQEG